MATPKQLDYLSGIIHSHSIELGLLKASTLTALQHGSKHDCIAFCLYTLQDGDTADHTHPACRLNAGYLGMTKPEAYQSLCLIADVLSSVVEVHRANKL